MNIELIYLIFLCLDEILSCNLFQNQISQLVISVIPRENLQQYTTMKYIINHILSVFKKLTHLIFTESSYSNIVELHDDPSISFSSSTLSVLKVKLSSFGICLLLVDGRFNQLHTLIVDIAEIYLPVSGLPNKVCSLLER